MALAIFLRTLPYVLMRALVFLAFGAASIVFVALVLGVGLLIVSIVGGGASIPFIIIVAVIGGLWGLTRLAQRYVLYLIKIGHVAVVTELVLHGALPEGTNQFSYGKDKVVGHFGSATALFAVDQLVAGSVRQIQGWLTSAAGCVTRVPGLGAVVAIAKGILSIAANYVDEAVMSYILQRGEEDVWQAAADGVVLYAQSWKRLLTTSALLAVLVSVVWLAGFALFVMAGLATYPLYGPQLGADTVAYGIIVALPALFLVSIFQWLLVDPLATVAMVVSYSKAIAGQTPSVDLHAQLRGVSPRFRAIAERAGTGAVTRPLGA